MNDPTKKLPDGVTVLPDGSAFAVWSYPLPKDHWLYAPWGEWDSEREESAECPQPILTNAHRDAVIAAARYAIRGATSCGQEADFDPDAMALNFAYAMCGPAAIAIATRVAHPFSTCSQAEENQHD